MKPTHVFVEHAESPLLKTTVYPFQAFERIAQDISNDKRNACCKTWVVVMFDSGDSYSCRIDIDNTISGFESHIRSCLDIYRRRMRQMEAGEDIAKPILDSYEELLPTWQSIQFETSKNYETEQDIKNLAHYKQCLYNASQKLDIADYILMIQSDEAKRNKVMDDLRFQVNNNASEVIQLEKKLGKGLFLKLYESNGLYGKEGVTDNYRVYFKGDNTLLYCVQPDHTRGLELMRCTKDGEPSHAITTRYFVFEGSTVDSYKLSEYKGRDAVYQFYSDITPS